jgi:DNA helicase HerA-like ATPase
MTARITAIYGGTGSGKSYATKRALSRSARFIVFDPQHEYGPVCGGEVVSSPPELIRAMNDNYRHFKIAYQPEGDRIMSDELDIVSKVCWDWSEYLPGLTLVIEEANLGYPPEQLPADKRGVQRLILQGRHREVKLVAITQRPKLIHPNLRGEAQRMVVFRLQNYSDLQVLKEMVGPDYINEISNLQPQESLTFELNRKTAANENFSI